MRRSCVTVEAAVLGSRPLPNKPTVSADVKQRSTNHQNIKGQRQKTRNPERCKPATQQVKVLGVKHGPETITTDQQTPRFFSFFAPWKPYGAHRAPGKWRGIVRVLEAGLAVTIYGSTTVISNTPAAHFPYIHRGREGGKRDADSTVHTAAPKVVYLTGGARDLWSRHRVYCS